MVVRVATVAFEGIEARPVDVQVQVSNGNVAFTVVGLGDKAVGESRERVRSALIATGLAMPARRVTVNLAPADMPKEGSLSRCCDLQNLEYFQLFFSVPMFSDISLAST
jgi:magnesium chelatase family protein